MRIRNPNTGALFTAAASGLSVAVSVGHSDFFVSPQIFLVASDDEVVSRGLFDWWTSRSFRGSDNSTTDVGFALVKLKNDQTQDSQRNLLDDDHDHQIAPKNRDSCFVHFSSRFRKLVIGGIVSGMVILVTVGTVYAAIAGQNDQENSSTNSTDFAHQLALIPNGTVLIKYAMEQCIEALQGEARNCSGNALYSDHYISARHQGNNSMHNPSVRDPYEMYLSALVEMLTRCALNGSFKWYAACQASNGSTELESLDGLHCPGTHGWWKLGKDSGGEGLLGMMFSKGTGNINRDLVVYLNPDSLRHALEGIGNLAESSEDYQAIDEAVDAIGTCLGG